jgi:colanic acid/amylovoran biosynthesis glycosyltransferase
LNGPSIIYLLYAFPQLSETFILNEILQLQKRGSHVHVFSLARSREAKVHRKAVALIETTVYLSELRREEKIRALARLILRHPIRLLKSTWFVMCQDGEIRSWTFRQAIYVAGEAIRLGIRHIHAHFAVETAEHAMLASMLSGISYSMTGHAVDIYVRQKLLREKMNRAKFVVTVCDYNKKHLLEINPVFPDDRLHVIRVGIDADLFSRNHSTQDHEKKHGLFHIASIARLVEKKGIRYLIEALAILKREDVVFQCTIVGEGPERAMLENLVNERQLESMVRLIGAQESDQVRSILHGADVFVLPCVVARNGDRDATPTVLLEAMAMGIPVVSTSIGGIPEVVPKEAGILVVPGDAPALARAIKAVAELKANERTAMGEQGRKHVSAYFNSETEVQRLATLFFNGS